MIKNGFAAVEVKRGAMFLRDSVQLDAFAKQLPILVMERMHRVSLARLDRCSSAAGMLASDDCVSNRNQN